MGMEDIGLDMVMQGPITPMSLTARFVIILIIITIILITIIIQIVLIIMTR